MRFLLFFLSVSIMASAAYAADETAEKLDAKTQAILKNLDENEIRQFAAIRNAHGILRAVENTDEMIEMAAKSCAAHNPKMAGQMNSRYAEWSGNLKPVLSSGQQRLNEMIRLQSYDKPANVKAYLKTLDQAVAENQKKIDIVPIKKKSECDDLLEEMDDKEEKLTRLLVKSLNLNRQLKTK